MRLETERLILRKPLLRDLNDLVENLNDKNICKYVKSIPYPYTKKDAKWWINKCEEEFRRKIKKEYPFNIELKSEKKIVGGIGIHKFDSFGRTAEIGYWVGKKYWRQGIISEAIYNLLDFSFDKLRLRRIELQAYSENTASNGVAKKFGFKFEGTRRRAVRAKATGKIHDINVYGLLREEWKKHRKKLK